MAFKIGSLAGGLAKGFLAGSQTRMQQQRLEQEKSLKEQELRNKQLDQFRKETQNLIKLWKQGIETLKPTPGPVVSSVDEQREQMVSELGKILRIRPDMKGKENVIDATLQSLRATKSTYEINQEKLEFEAAKEKQSLAIKGEDGGGPLVNLRKDGKVVTVRRDDPRVDELIQQGYTKSTAPSISGVVVPLIQKILDGKELSPSERKALNEAKGMSPMNQLMQSLLNPMDFGVSTGQFDTLMKQARDSIANGAPVEEVKKILKSKNVPDELIRSL